MAISGARFNPFSILAVLLVVGGAAGLVRERFATEGEPPCDPLDVTCEVNPGFAAASAPQRARAAPVVGVEEACRNAGYLCADIEQRDRIRIQRWKDLDGPLVVHVPRPDFEGTADAVELQRAAVLGLRAWNEHPFPILVDTRGDREAHFSVRWTSSLGGSQIGVARTQWSPSTGLTVVSIELATRNPYAPSNIIDARQVRLTAAHEMGHALGLPHSDSSHDVMYPTNTAAAVSARDMRTMEVLYGVADGTEITR